jgi:hypothetical protein
MKGIEKKLSKMKDEIVSIQSEESEQMSEDQAA